MSAISHTGSMRNIAYTVGRPRPHYRTNVGQAEDSGHLSRTRAEKSGMNAEEKRGSLQNNAEDCVRLRIIANKNNGFFLSFSLAVVYAVVRLCPTSLRKTAEDKNAQV